MKSGDHYKLRPKAGRGSQLAWVVSAVAPRGLGTCRKAQACCGADCREIWSQRTTGNVSSTDDWRRFSISTGTPSVGHFGRNLGLDGTPATSHSARRCANSARRVRIPRSACPRGSAADLWARTTCPDRSVDAALVASACPSLRPTCERSLTRRGSGVHRALLSCRAALGLTRYGRYRHELRLVPGPSIDRRGRPAHRRSVRRRPRRTRPRLHKELL